MPIVGRRREPALPFHSYSYLYHLYPRSNGVRTMNVRPLGDKLIVKRQEAATKTESGIYLPESAKDKPKTGTVVALGSGNLNKDTGEYLPFTVKKGETVIFSSYAGTEIKIDGDEMLIMTEEDILGIVD